MSIVPPPVEIAGGIVLAATLSLLLFARARALVPRAVLARPVVFSAAADPELRKWIVLAAATFGLMGAFGASTSVGIFMKPLEDEFGWLRADISLAYTLLSTGAALGGIVFGHAVDRMDSRPLVVLGAATIGVGMMLLSQIGSLFALQGAYLLIGALGMACLYTPLLTSVGLWFDRGRGLAVGILTAGGTLGQAVMPPLAQALITSFGWSQAYLLLGIGYLLLVAPVMLLVTKPPAPAARSAAASAPAETGAVRPAVTIAWFGFAAIFCCITMAVPNVHLVTLALGQGLTPAEASGLFTTLMLTATVGRVLFGIVADRIGALRSYALASFVQTVTVFWFVKLEWVPGLYLLAMIYGIGFSGVMTSLNLSLRQAVPARVFGTATASVGLLAWLGMGVGGFQGGHCFDVTGDYTLSFANAALAGVINLAVIGAYVLYRRRVTDGRRAGRLAAVPAAA